MNFSKRILSFILVMALLVSVIPMGAAAASDVIYGIAFTKANLRLRSSASTSSTSLDTAPKGDVVLVLSESGNGWYKVSYNGQEGYMSGTHLNIQTTGNAELGYGTINASKVNMRKGPGASHGILAIGTKGSSAYVVGIENGWYRVIYGSNVCYIRSDYLDLTEIPYENSGSSKSPVFYRDGTSTGVEVSAGALNHSGSTSGSASSDSSASNASNASTSGSSATATGQIYGIAFTTGSGLRLRSSASTSGSTLASASKGEVVVVMEKNGDWCKVIYNLKEGYMHADYLNIQTTGNAELGYGSVTGNSVNLRKNASTSAGKVASANKGDIAYIVGVENGWYRVIFGSNICFIRSDFLALTQVPYENKASSNAPVFYRGGNSTGVNVSASALGGSSASKPSNSGSTPSASTSTSGSSTGSKIVETAKKYLGVPYVYGGTSPSGFDCSGFVYYVLKIHGITIARTCASMYNCGTKINKSDLQPGDLVFFQGTSAAGISHVGIYVGNGQFIHSPHRGKVVSFSDLSSGYYAEHYYGAIRVI